MNKYHLDTNSTADRKIADFDENKDYLFTLPLNELLLNPSLKQKPNW